MKELKDLYEELDEGVQTGDTALIRNVIDAARNAPFCRNRVESMLHLAIKCNNFTVVQTLLRAKADVNYCDDVAGRRAIHAAAETGNIDILRTIINNGSPINVVDGQGISPLHACMEAGHQKSALLLIDQGATVNRPRRYDNGEAPIHTASRLAMNDVIRGLARKGGDMNLRLNKISPLHIAVKEKHSWTAKVLCECGADVNSRDASGATPFLLAVHQTSVEMVRALLPFSVDVNACDKEGSSALHYICAAHPPSISQMEIINILISNEADIFRVNNQGRTALHMAAETGNLAVIRALIDAGAPLNVVDRLLGETPLNTAAAHNHLEAIRLLAEHGADVNIPDNHLMMPLHKIHFARGFQKYASTDFLLTRGARVNAEDDRGVSPLMWCVSRSIQGTALVTGDDGFDAMRRLVAAGAHLHPDLNRRSIQHSPLCWLTWQGYLEPAAFLVNSGWDLRGEVWRILPGKTQAIETFLERLRDLNSSPWSLRALCRRVIRDTLSEACDDRDVTPGVECLDLPRSVKQFLTFDLEGDEL